MLLKSMHTKSPFLLQPEEGAFVSPVVAGEPDYCCGACVAGATAASLGVVVAFVVGFTDVAS